jgi:cell division inhibitor SepF
VNLQGVDRALLQRIVDFTSGVAYTLDGKIQKLADAMYLVVPPGVAVNSQGLRDSLGGDSLLDFMTNRGESR